MDLSGWMKLETGVAGTVVDVVNMSTLAVIRLNGSYTRWVLYVAISLSPFSPIRVECAGKFSSRLCGDKAPDKLTLDSVGRPIPSRILTQAGAVGFEHLDTGNYIKRSMSKLSRKKI